MKWVRGMLKRGGGQKRTQFSSSATSRNSLSGSVSGANSRPVSQRVSPTSSVSGTAKNSFAEIKGDAAAGGVELSRLNGQNHEDLAEKLAGVAADKVNASTKKTNSIRRSSSSASIVDLLRRKSFGPEDDRSASSSFDGKRNLSAGNLHQLTQPGGISDVLLPFNEDSEVAVVDDDALMMMGFSMGGEDSDEDEEDDDAFDVMVGRLVDLRHTAPLVLPLSCFLLPFPFPFPFPSPLSLSDSSVHTLAHFFFFLSLSLLLAAPSLSTRSPLSLGLETLIL